MPTKLHYRPEELLNAWDLLIEATDTLSSGLFFFDLVEITQQVLSNYFLESYENFLLAYEKEDLKGVQLLSQRMEELIQDMDSLLTSHPRFLLGKWIEAAKSWGNNDEEKRLMEWNARNQVTLWFDFLPFVLLPSSISLLSFFFRLEDR